MAKEVSIRLESNDTLSLDESVKKILNTMRNVGVKVKVIPLPTRKEQFSVAKSPHVYKESSECYIIETHKRLMLISNITQDQMKELAKIKLFSGVYISIRI